MTPQQKARHEINHVRSKGITDLYEVAVLAIINDLQDRQGFDSLRSLDEETKQEIQEVWTQILRKIFERT